MNGWSVRVLRGQAGLYGQQLGHPRVQELDVFWLTFCMKVTNYNLGNERQHISLSNQSLQLDLQRLL